MTANRHDNRARHPALRLFLILLGCVGLGLVGAVGAPIAGYVVGKHVIGAYEGRLGLMDYAGSIYAAAGRGEFLAWWLILSPLLIAAVWYLVFRLGRRV